MQGKMVTKPYRTTSRSRLPKLMRKGQTIRRVLLPVAKDHPRRTLERFRHGTIRIPNPCPPVGRDPRGSAIFSETDKVGFTISITGGCTLKASTNQAFGFTTKLLVGFTREKTFTRSFIATPVPAGCMISPVRPGASFGTMRAMG